MKHVNLGTVTFTERKTLRQYEHREVSSTATVPEGVCAIEAAKELKAFVLDLLHDRGEFTKDVSLTLTKGIERAEKPTTQALKKVKGLGKRESGEQEVEENETEAPSPKQPSVPEIEEEDDHEQKETEPDEDDKEETEKPQDRTTAKKKNARGRPKSKATGKMNKNTPYERTLDTHKNLVGAWLDKHYKGWRNNKPVFNKAIAASKELNGEDLLDSDGEMLQSFIDAFEELMEA